MHLGDSGREDAPWEFETLLGLGPDRLAEDPRRLLTAVVDAAG